MNSIGIRSILLGSVLILSALGDKPQTAAIVDYDTIFGTRNFPNEENTVLAPNHSLGSLVENREITQQEPSALTVACKLQNKSKAVCIKKCKNAIHWSLPKGCNKVCKKCLGSGEKNCERKGLKKKRCLAVGCCQWGEDGKCRSAVGNRACKPYVSPFFGGCHILKECKKCVKTPLKYISALKSLPKAGTSMMSMKVSGLHLVGLKSSEGYSHWCWVVKVITEILSDSVTDLSKQKELIRNLYKRKVVAKIITGEPLRFKDSFVDSNSICDQIKVKLPEKDPSRQISEVLEHVLHFIHIGERYTFIQWNTDSTTESAAWEAVKEAEAAGVYDTIAYYNQFEDGEERRRVILQEFHFWLVFADWNLLKDGEFDLGFGEWQGVDNLKQMRVKLPKTYKLYTETTGTVLKKPSIETIRSLGKLRKGSIPDKCEI